MNTVWTKDTPSRGESIVIRAIYRSVDAVFGSTVAQEILNTVSNSERLDRYVLRDFIATQF